MITRRYIIVLSILLILAVSFGYLSLLPYSVPRANQWAEKAVQIDKLHMLGFDGSGVVIGIIDTGVDTQHQEFDDDSFLSWTDLINQKNRPYDDEDHGTHVTGLLIAKGSYEGLISGVNLNGIAPKARILHVKAIPANQYFYDGGNSSIIAEGIQFCVDQHVDILVVSMGVSPEKINFAEKNKVLQALDRAIACGIFVIVPAGNDGQNDDGDVCFPATHPHVISVGSIANNYLISPFSSKGHQYPGTIDPNKKPELVAPGENILSTRIHGSYGELSGTAQAAVYTAGVLALLLNAYPEYKPSCQEDINTTAIHVVKQILAQSAKKIGNLEGAKEIFTHDDWYGYGLIQAYDAYIQLAQYRSS
ncbi:MAG: S8 family serine peptidase [Candidatus Thermoplasmatota archaeon]